MPWWDEVESQIIEFLNVNLDLYEDSGECDCDDCYEERIMRETLVHSYGFKPTPVFHGKGPLFLGPELEIELPDDDTIDEYCQYAADRLGSLGYLKSDGSLCNGVEIVTHPMSYAWAIENFPWDMLTELRRMGAYTIPEHTGLHVHVSKAGFRSPCHAYRWMKFIYRNEDDVCALARRRTSQWAAFNPDQRREIKKFVKGDTYGAIRYSAVNPTNEHTYELRMFAASLRPERVQAALGFAAASVEYTRDLTAARIAKEGGWTWPAFYRWVAEREEYEPLRIEMEKRTTCVS